MDSPHHGDRPEGGDGERDEVPEPLVREREVLIRIEDVCKNYELEGDRVRALVHVSLVVRRGEYLTIMGPSGSGKSTLMNIIGCLDVPTSGRYVLDGRDVAALTKNELAGLRNRQIGFVFQSFNLMARTTALRNVEIPMIYAGMRRAERRAQALELLEYVGLGERVHHRPSQLSGGQKQRVAIARALANGPSLLLADEPTGNIDSQTGEKILLLFDRLHADGNTIITVTHEEAVARRAQRIVKIGDGQIVADERAGAAAS